jgi:hypothetical protein
MTVTETEDALWLEQVELLADIALLEAREPTGTVTLGIAREREDAARGLCRFLAYHGHAAIGRVGRTELVIV